MKVTLLLSLFISTSIASFPGDQDSLSCVDSNYAYRTKYINQYRNRDATNANWLCTQSDPAQKEACIEKNKADAIADVTKAVRSNYDTSKHFTKMGDSLSDFVDFYGMADPRKLNIEPTGGSLGGITPWYMDSWNDYYSIPTRVKPFNGNNFAVAGASTVMVLDSLGIVRTGDKEYWDIGSDSNTCLAVRSPSYSFAVNYIEPVPPHPADPRRGISSPRTVLMIGGNDILHNIVGGATWFPFLNKHLTDLSIANISTIIDWHLENGKQIYLEGTLPVFSHPTSGGYDGVIVNRYTLCRPVTDLCWIRMIFPGMHFSFLKFGLEFWSGTEALCRKSQISSMSYGIQKKR